MKLALIVGTRPNFIKAKPLLKALKDHAVWVIHTGQHYSETMDQWESSDIPMIHLNVGSGSLGYQVGAVTEELCIIFKKHLPRFDMVIVIGDVNSTLGAALAAKHENLPLAHVEAGVRSGDMSMQEEVNRILVDRLSDYHFVPSERAKNQLKREGITENVFNVGNIHADVFYSTKPEDLYVPASEFYFCTIHRAQNVDDPVRLQSILDALNEVNKKHSVIISMHPRTARRIKEFNVKVGSVHYWEPPLLYPACLTAIKSSLGVITDSGGLQVEAMLAKKRCFTLRPNTEWKETILAGWNRLCEPQTLLAKINEANAEPFPPAFTQWDGTTAKQIAGILSEEVRLKEAV